MMRWVIVVVVASSSTLADLLQAAGMKEHAAIHKFQANHLFGQLTGLISNKKLLASVGCLAVSFTAFLALVSVAELSFAAPATAVTFVLETILAACVLKEQVDWRRYAGATLVTGGVMLLML